MDNVLHVSYEGNDLHVSYEGNDLHVSKESFVIFVYIILSL